MSEDHRADMLFEQSGLSKREKNMIQASIQNGRDFQKVADALMLQHPRVHVNEEHRRRSEIESKISDEDCRLEESLITRMTDANEFKPRSHTKVPPSADRDVAYAAEEGDDDGEERHACTSEVEDFVAEQCGEAVYIASSSEDEGSKETQSRQDEQEYAESDEEATELDAITFLCDKHGIDGDFDYGDVHAKVAEMQSAYAAKAEASYRGRIPGKSRGGNTSIADRKRKLAELRSKFTCVDCGRRGHKASDS